MAWQVMQNIAMHKRIALTILLNSPLSTISVSYELSIEILAFIARVYLVLDVLSLLKVTVAVECQNQLLLP